MVYQGVQNKILEEKYTVLLSTYENESNIFKQKIMNLNHDLQNANAKMLQYKNDLQSHKKEYSKLKKDTSYTIKGKDEKIKFLQSHQNNSTDKYIQEINLLKTKENENKKTILKLQLDLNTALKQGQNDKTLINDLKKRKFDEFNKDDIDYSLNKNISFNTPPVKPSPPLLYDQLKSLENQINTLKQENLELRSSCDKNYLIAIENENLRNQMILHQKIALDLYPKEKSANKKLTKLIKEWDGFIKTFINLHQSKLGKQDAEICTSQKLSNSENLSDVETPLQNYSIKLDQIMNDVKKREYEHEYLNTKLQSMETKCEHLQMDLNKLKNENETLLLTNKNLEKWQQDLSHYIKNTVKPVYDKFLQLQQPTPDSLETKELIQILQNLLSKYAT